MGRTCGEPDEIKKNTHPEYITALCRAQVWDVATHGWVRVKGTFDVYVGSSSRDIRLHTQLSLA